MSVYPINFTVQDNALAYQLYQTLLAQGVTAQDMDQGWRETNSAGIHCPNKTDSFCMQGTPGVLEANDVLEYAFNHDQKYQALLVKALGEPLPWSLDDLDPATVFDEQIRARVQEAIDVLRGILKTNGIAEGSEDYKERMAVGMFYLVSLPKVQDISNSQLNFSLPAPMRNLVNMQELVGLGLGAFKEYLKSHGGFYITGDNSEEYSAIEAIKNEQGECTEKSKILFAMMRMAGLEPELVFIERQNLKSDDPQINKLIKMMPINFSHVCLGLRFGNRFRLFDPSLFTSDASYANNTPVTLRQSLSDYYSNRSSILKNKSQPENAILASRRSLEIDSENFEAYNNLGSALLARGEMDEAIVSFTKAQQIDPKFALAFYNCGIAFFQKRNLDEAIKHYTRAIEVEPEFASAYNNRGNTFLNQDKLDEASADLRRSLELDPDSADARLNYALVLILKADFKPAIKELAVNFKIEPGSIEKNVRTLQGAFNKFWQSDSTRIQTAKQFEADTGGWNLAKLNTFLFLSYVLWEAEMTDQSKETLKSISYAIGNCVSAKFSPTTKTFFNDMFKLMPLTMQQDKEVREIQRVMQEKIKP